MRSKIGKFELGRSFGYRFPAIALNAGCTTLSKPRNNVEVTSGSGDHGVDIILRRAGRTTVVQCKQNKHPVGPVVARELYGTLIASKADDGILAAVGGVTTGVCTFFSDKSLRVMGLSELFAPQNEIQSSPVSSRS